MLLKFTKTPPTKPGAYWWKHNRYGKSILVVIEKRGRKLIDESSDLPPSQVGGLWSQRLVPEKE